jgi:hypothetical protein
MKKANWLPRAERIVYSSRLENRDWSFRQCDLLKLLSRSQLSDIFLSYVGWNVVDTCLVFFFPVLL